jgi:hypothetical protein
MADLREDLNKTAEELTKAAQEAAYIAVGLGVIGFQRAQVARRELMAQFERQMGSPGEKAGEVRAQAAKAWKGLDDAVSQLIEQADATLEPVAARLPEQAQELVKQVQGLRDQVRDQVRGYVESQLVA